MRHSGKIGTCMLLSAAMAGSAMAQGGDMDCAARISTLEAKLEADTSRTAMERQAFAAAFEQAATFCQSGNEMLAQQYLNALEQEFPTDTDGGAVEAEASTEIESEVTPAPEVASGPDYGEARDDLGRFYGLYALPDGSGRKMFVAPATSNNPDRPIPEGYIMIGAMWGDAGNWYMKSVSDTGFRQRGVPEGYEPVIVEFTVDGSGQANAMSVQSSFMSYDRMERVSDLPEDWR